jgi:hypothetical protein
VGTLFDPGIFNVLGIDGALLSGALLNWYDTGTANRHDTYTSSALSVANTNPVVADSQGRFPQIWLASGSYKFVLTDASGVVIRTQDPYVVDAAAPTIAAALNNFLAGLAALPIANGGTGQTSAANAIAALGGMPLTGGAFTGDITKSTKGGYLYFNTAAMASGKVYLTASGDPDPRGGVAGSVWLKY